MTVKSNSGMAVSVAVVACKAVLGKLSTRCHSFLSCQRCSLMVSALLACEQLFMMHDSSN